MSEEPTKSNNDVGSTPITEHQFISLSRRELYGLFVIALSVPFLSFASGMYMGNNGHDHTSKMEAQQLHHIKQSPKCESLNVKTEKIRSLAANDLGAKQAFVSSETQQLKPSNEDVINEAQIDSSLSGKVKSGNQAQLVSNATNNVVLTQSKQNIQKAASEKSSRLYSSESKENVFIVQVGLFKDPLSAQKRRSQLNNELDSQFDYWILPRVSSEHGKRYAVIIGFYKNRLDALKAADNFETTTLSDAYVAKLNSQQVEMTLANL